MKIGDTVRLQAVVTDISASGNPIVMIKTGQKFLIKKIEVTLVRSSAANKPLRAEELIKNLNSKKDSQNIL